MDKFRNYSVSFSGLKVGKHKFKFEIKQEFFNLFEAEQEFSNTKIEANVLLEKHSTFLDFDISIDGTVDLICDISNKTFEQNIENDIKILVKFGEEYNDSNEEVIVIPQKDSEFNISQLIYEAVVLAIPMKKVAPDVAENNEYENLLEKFSPENKEETIGQENIDPRWEVLKKLKK